MIGLMPDHDEVVEATAATEATMRPQNVPVNVYESPEALVVVAPFPAVVNTDAKVELRDGVLRLSARLRSSGPRDYLIHEWEYGGYEREIAVPDRYAGGLEATLTNGQLAVRVLRGDSQPGASITPG
jgi:HSP20 family molecular chaperone IbpA